MLTYLGPLKKSHELTYVMCHEFLALHFGQTLHQLQNPLA